MTSFRLVLSFLTFIAFAVSFSFYVPPYISYAPPPEDDWHATTTTNVLYPYVLSEQEIQALYERGV